MQDAVTYHESVTVWLADCGDVGKEDPGVELCV